MRWEIFSPTTCVIFLEATLRETGAVQYFLFQWTSNSDNCDVPLSFCIGPFFMVIVHINIQWNTLRVQQGQL